MDCFPKDLRMENGPAPGRPKMFMGEEIAGTNDFACFARISSGPGGPKNILQKCPSSLLVKVRKRLIKE